MAALQFFEASVPGLSPTPCSNSIASFGGSSSVEGVKSTPSPLLRRVFEECDDVPLPARRRRGTLVKSESTSNTDRVGGLWGYSQPSTAKHLFRIRRGPSKLYLWPRHPPSFATHAMAAMAHLEDLNFACLSVLLAAVDDNGRAPRLDAAALLRSYSDTSHLAGRSSDSARFLHSPFDFFYYHNHDYVKLVLADTVDAKVAAARSPNCLPHIDPGFLGCIPVSTTAGLMIQDSRTKAWVDVESLPGVRPYRDVIVFAGWTLQVASCHRIPAAVHVVRGNSRPRLSLVYERRLEDNGDGFAMECARIKKRKLGERK